jgi:hypothetical protein
MGGSFGVAIFGAIMTSTVTNVLPGLLPDDAAAGSDPNQLLNSPEAIRALPTEVADAVIDALAQGIHNVFLWAVPVLLVGFVFCWIMRELPLRETANVGSASLEGAEQMLESADHELALASD